MDELGNAPLKSLGNTIISHGCDDKLHYVTNKNEDKKIIYTYAQMPYLGQ